MTIYYVIVTKCASDVGSGFDFVRLKFQITKLHVSCWWAKNSNNVDINLSNEGVTLDISCRNAI